MLTSERVVYCMHIVEGFGTSGQEAGQIDFSTHLSSTPMLCKASVKGDRSCVACNVKHNAAGGWHLFQIYAVGAS